MLNTRILIEVIGGEVISNVVLFDEDFAHPIGVYREDQFAGMIREYQRQKNVVDVVKIKVEKHLDESVAL